jgi:hypothetical protein
VEDAGDFTQGEHEYEKEHRWERTLGFSVKVKEEYKHGNEDVRQRMLICVRCPPSAICPIVYCQQ